MLLITTLPKEIQHDILWHLDEIVDQVAAALAHPLWCSILQIKSLQATRYQPTGMGNSLGYPLIHNLFFETADQISCVVKDGAVTCFRLRFLRGEWWDNPNLQDTWDISNCPFLDEPLVKAAVMWGPPWKLEIETHSPLSYTVPQLFECTETTTVRDFLIAGSAGNINLPGYIEGEGFPPGTRQEITVSRSTIYGFRRDSRIKNETAQDPNVIMITNFTIVRRSTKQYLEWMATDQHLESSQRPV
ncbi:hypothetical protein TWF730_000032 [Orbilia blumenaviensis]|uniref:Uncharacterized protein n=1 Tax=Orbilia blumenaviensis TaxID=1796055 RepID=A0AAV9VN56_9PEZI